MQKLETTLPGVWELRPKVDSDSRGFFLETFNAQKFVELGINDTFVQDNHSYSAHGTLRGLHYQRERAQAKLCRVIEGLVLDVVVDIRRDSPHFGKTTTILLSAQMQNQLYVPAGFAHGFLALRGPAQFLYKCSDFYDPSDEYGIIWNDPGLAIPWDFASPSVSQRDSAFPSLRDVLDNAPENLPIYVR